MRCPVPAHIGLYRDERERRNRIALPLHQVHFRDFFVQRAAVGFDSQRIAFRRAVFFPVTRRAGIFVALMTNQAIINFVKRIAHRAAVVGQLKTVAPAHLAVRAAQTVMQFRFGMNQVNEILIIERVRNFERIPFFLSAEKLIADHASRICKRFDLQIRLFLLFHNKSLKNFAESFVFNLS